MDRNFKLTELFYCFDSLSNKIPVKKEFGQRPVKLPLSRTSPFAVMKKLVIPKQVNDRVWVKFSGDFSDIYMFVNGISLFPDESGLYEITPHIKRGKPVITGVIKSGSISGLEVTVKRIPKTK